MLGSIHSINILLDIWLCIIFTPPCLPFISLPPPPKKKTSNLFEICLLKLWLLCYPRPGLHNTYYMKGFELLFLLNTLWYLAYSTLFNGQFLHHPIFKNRFPSLEGIKTKFYLNNYLRFYKRNACVDWELGLLQA